MESCVRCTSRTRASVPESRFPATGLVGGESRDAEATTSKALPVSVDGDLDAGELRHQRQVGADAGNPNSLVPSASAWRTLMPD